MDPIEQLRAALRGDNPDDGTWQVLEDALQEAGDPEGRVLSVARRLLDPDRPNEAVAAAMTLADPRWLVEVVARCWTAGQRDAVFEGGRGLGLDLSVDVQRALETWLAGINTQRRVNRVRVEMVLSACAEAEFANGVGWEGIEGLALGSGGESAFAFAFLEHDHVVLGGGFVDSLMASNWQPSKEWVRQWAASRPGDDCFHLPRVFADRGDVVFEALDDWVACRRRILDRASHVLAIDSRLQLDVDRPDLPTVHYEERYDTLEVNGWWRQPAPPDTTGVRVWSTGASGAEALANDLGAKRLPGLRALRLELVRPLGAEAALSESVWALTLQSLSLWVRSDDEFDPQPLIEGCTNLTELALTVESQQLTRALELGGLRKLRRLRLLGEWPLDSVAAMLRQPGVVLEALELRGPLPHPPDALVELLAGASGLTGLSGLHLPGVALDETTLQRLCRAFPGLEVLDISGMEDGLGLDAFDIVFRCLPRLRALDLSGRPLGDPGVARLVQVVEDVALETLRLGAFGIGDRGLAELSRSSLIERVRRLDLSKNVVRLKGMRSLVRSPKAIALQELDLSRNRIGVSGAKVLADWVGLSNVQIIDLTATGIGREGARALERSRFFRARERRGFPSL